MSQSTEIRQRPAQRLYCVKDAAVYLGRTEWGVRELIWSHELPVIKSGRGGKQYIDVFDMDAYIEKNKANLR